MLSIFHYEIENAEYLFMLFEFQNAYSFTYNKNKCKLKRRLSIIGTYTIIT